MAGVSPLSLRAMICIALLIVYTREAENQASSAITPNIGRQPVYVAVDNPLPEHSDDQLPHPQNTLEAPVAEGTIRSNLPRIHRTDSY